MEGAVSEIIAKGLVAEQSIEKDQTVTHGDQVILVVSSGSTAGDRLGQRLGRALARTAGGSFLTAAGGGQVSAALRLPLTDCAPCPPFDPTGQYGTAAGLLWEFGVWD